MIYVFKRLICLAFAFAAVTLTVFAAKTNVKIKVDKEFTVLSKGENEEELASILGITADELKEYCSENGIEYLAVNSDNTKQVKLSVQQTEFSSAAINFSNLSDENIEAVIPEIIGISNVKSEIKNKNGQKFAVIDLSSYDSGGDYTVNQYITVADKKLFVLSVYTSEGNDTGYADEIFESLYSGDFNRIKPTGNSYSYVIVGAIVILVGVCAFVTVTLIRDIRSDSAVKKSDDGSETDS